MRYRFWLLLLPFLFLALFYFYPIARIFSLSFSFDGEWDFGKFVQRLAKSHYIGVFWFTVWQALLSTLLAVVVALPGAYLFSQYQFPGKRLLKFLSTLPFVLPTVVVASALQALLGESGLVNLGLMRLFHLPRPPIRIDHSIWFILIAHVFYNYSVIFRIVGGFWAGIRDEISEAASMLGASPARVFFQVTLPLLRPALLASSLLVFVLCFSSFGVVLILGGPKYATVEVEIYRQTVNYFNLPAAATLSLIQIVFTFLVMWLYTGASQKGSLQLDPKMKTARPKPIRRFGKAAIVANAGFILFFLGAPLFALLVRSLLLEDRFSFVYYSSLFADRRDSIFFVPPTHAIFYSLGFASAALVTATVLGLLLSNGLASRGGRTTSILDAVFMLPLSTSAVTLGFGFIIALDRPPVNLRTSILLIPIAHTLVALPFVTRSILPSIRSIPQSLRESASVLGASPLRVWIHVDVPVVKRAVVIGAIFAFTISLGEFGATLFVARPNSPTIPLAIYRFLGQPGSLNYGQALAMSNILLLVTVCGFILLERLRGNTTDEI